DCRCQQDKCNIIREQLQVNSVHHFRMSGNASWPASDEDTMPIPRMPGRNFLFVPGPTNIPDRVMRSMVVAMEDHRSSRFPELTRNLFTDLLKLYGCDEGEVFIFPSTGTGAWEASLCNTLSPGDKVLAPRFGQFS